MSERCLWKDYELRGYEFEVWTDGSRNGDYPNWWLVASHEAAKALGLAINTVLTEKDFTPELTDAEISKISEACYDYFVC